MKSADKIDTHGWTWQRALPYVLLVASIVGLLASFSLTYDKIQVLQNPHYKPLCNLNPVLSCGSVMKTTQASLLGVPNTVFGLMAFSGLATISLVMLAGATFKRWMWLVAQAVATAGVVFMHYLFFQAVFRIHAICPWCFGVWMVTIPTFWGITVCNIRAGYFVQNRWSRRIGTFVNRYSTDLLVLWYFVIIGTLLVKFWYYWSTLV